MAAWGGPDAVGRPRRRWRVPARLEQARHQLEEAERIAGMWQGGPWLAAVWEARGDVDTRKP